MAGTWSVHHTHAANSCMAGGPMLFLREKHPSPPLQLNVKLDMGVLGIPCLEQLNIDECVPFFSDKVQCSSRPQNVAYLDTWLTAPKSWNKTLQVKHFHLCSCL